MNFLKKALGYIFFMPSKPVLKTGVQGRKGIILQRLISVLGICTALVCPLYSYLMLEYFHFSSAGRLLWFFNYNLSAVLFGIGLFYLLFLCLMLIFRKAWGASLFMTLFCILTGLINHYKYASTGDFLYPWDFVQATNVGELSGFIDFSLPLAFYILIVLSLAFPIITFFSSTELPIYSYIRIPLLCIIFFLMSSSVSTPAKVTEFLNRNGMYLEDMALQSSNYEANGFTGAFTVNLLSGKIQKPEGYGSEGIDEILGDREYVGEKENFVRPDIIIILSESFWNPNLLKNTEYSENPVKGYEELCSRDGSVSGLLFQTGFGGGTVRPEFEILTGLTTDGLPGGSIPWQYITEKTDSYISLFDDLGYDTIALHPYTSSFYNRKSGYPKIGFHRLYFENELGSVLEVECERVSKSNYVSDKSFEKYIEYFLEDGGENPKLIFGISMENHQSYLDKYENCDIEVSGSFDQTTLNIVTNYVQGIKNADNALSALADYIDGRDRPTVLCYFGDHLPSLGSNYSAYVQSKTVSPVGSFTKEDRKLLQSTPFLIYANYPLTKESGLLKEGKDNSISSYNLLNGLAELIGAPKTPLMSFLSEYAEAIPYYNSRLFLETTNEQKRYINAHRMLTYDIVAGKRYSQN